uniref:RAD54 homolog B n=1 Tax=Sinocyclocheilus rhinocerous TaxID=307959 RepID=A0A673JSX1_9TELE
MLAFYLSQGALVMPRPTTDHQWLYNKSGSPLVDVVIDPHLTNHLRPHQREGVVFLYECLMGMRLPGRCGAILADEMGLGKTLQCVCVLWTLLRQGPYGGRPLLKRALVVCPGSLVKNWAAEFNKWLGREKGQCLHRGPGVFVWLFVCSVDQLKELDFGVLICDEGHRLKNSNIKTTSAVTALSCERRLILTGTPVQNDLQEFYSTVEKFPPDCVCLSVSISWSGNDHNCVFQEERCIGEECAAELFRLTGVFTLRRTQEIINQYLSERIEWTVFCKPTELQLRLFGVLLATRPIRACLSGASTHTYTHSPHLACINALKKLCNHPVLVFCPAMFYEMYEGGIMELFPEGYSTGAFSTADSGKLLVLTDLLSAIQNINRTDRVVLVSNYTQTLDLLQDVCDNIGYKWCRLDGQTPVAQRQRIVDFFNSPHSSNFLLLLSSKAGGVGLNLIGASHLVLYDIDWNPANDIQAMARVWRDGQKKTVHIYRFLTTGSIEEKIYQRQVSKQGLSGTVVDLSKKAEHISFSAEELRDLSVLTQIPPASHTTY